MARPPREEPREGATARHGESFAVAGEEAGAAPQALRRCGVRAVPRPGGRACLEFRLPGALHGIESGARPPPPIAGGGPDEAPEGALGLPRSLPEATERLDSSRLARRLFGDRFIDCFVATRRREEAVLGPHVGAFERARYIEVVWGRNR